MAERPLNIEYGVTDHPPPGQVALLGIQFAVIISVYLVIIVIIVRAAGVAPDVARSAVSFGMIALAIGTTLQALPRGPVGSGFLAPPVFSAIYLGPSILAAQVGGLPAVFAMTVFAGLIEITASRFLDRMRILIQPTISGLIICVIGLELGLVGMQQTLDVAGAGTPETKWHVIVSLATLSVAVGLSVWARGIWRMIASLTALLSGMAAALLAGIYEPGSAERLATADWFAMPGIGHIGYSFEPELIAAFLAAGIAATLRTVGVVTTCQRVNDAAWQQPNYRNIKKGVLADGIGCTIGGLLGTPGMNIAPSLVGVSVAAGVTSRIIAFSCAATLIVLAFLPKVALVFLILPMSVAGAILVFTASLMFAAGVQLLTTKPLDTRAMFVIGISILFGLTKKTNPEFFAHLPAPLHILGDSVLALSLAAAIGLTLLFQIGRRDEEIIAWRKSDEALAALKADLHSHAADWALMPETISRVEANIRQALRLLKEGGMIRRPLSIALAHQRNKLEVELSYVGLPLTVSDLRAQESEANEETPMMAGLQRIAVGVYPDGSSTVTNGEHVKLRLWFRA
jgi:NCS2 family nucleobase:cation symporter-2